LISSALDKLQYIRDSKSKYGLLGTGDFAIAFGLTSAAAGNQLRIRHPCPQLSKQSETLVNEGQLKVHIQNERLDPDLLADAASGRTGRMTLPWVRSQMQASEVEFLVQNGWQHLWQSSITRGPLLVMAPSYTAKLYRSRPSRAGSRTTDQRKRNRKGI